MAIVINTAPGTNASANDEMLFVVYEATKANDEVTYPDYRYVCDVYVDTTFVARIKARPDPTYRRGIFDVAAILRSYMSYGLKANYSNASESYTVKLNYTCKFGEEYSDTTYTNLTVDSAREAYESYETRPFEDTNVMGDVDGDFASSIPLNSNTYDVKWLLLPYWDNVSGISDFSAKFYNMGNQVGATVTISASGYVAKTIFQINAGFTKLSSGLTQQEKDSVEFYEITGNGKARRFYIKCNKYPVIVIAWLNKYGAYDSFTFGLVSKKPQK